jgi:hypothetical protein
MALLGFINIPVFIISLALGLFFIYIYQSDNRKIYVYPNPENVEHIQYKDATGACFGIKQTQVNCPADEGEISKIKAQG